MVTVREVLCRSALSQCRIGGIPHSVNPYVGCQHACAYCYARFMTRYRPHPEPWGSFVDIKANAPQVLADQLRKTKPKLTILSSVTDPYQPVEAKTHITRRCLEQLLAHNFPVTVLTKSAHVTRDTDLFKQFQSCEIGMTIITLDEDVRRHFEPVASPIRERLKALAALHDAGVPTYVFIGPILPIISEATLKDLVKALAEAGVGRVLVDRLNIKAGNWTTIRAVLENQYPTLLPKFEHALFKDEAYYPRLKEKLGETLTAAGLDHTFCY